MLRHMLLASLSGVVSLLAAEGSGFVSEAPVPAGWPVPTTTEVIELVNLPAYRAVEGPAFWPLFAHISMAGIPMTAPVTMGADADPERGRGPMRFLYPAADTPPGPVAGAVRVIDVPAQTVLRITWRGTPRTDEVARRTDQLRQAAAERQLTPSGEPMLCGYNSPMLPRDRRTWELALPVASAP